jgi:hypothetical protein
MKPTLSDCADSHLALCDAMGVHPCCGEALGDCDCEEPIELEDESGGAA